MIRSAASRAREPKSVNETPEGWRSNNGRLSSCSSEETAAEIACCVTYTFFAAAEKDPASAAWTKYSNCLISTNPLPTPTDTPGGAFPGTGIIAYAVDEKRNPNPNRDERGIEIRQPKERPPQHKKRPSEEPLNLYSRLVFSCPLTFAPWERNLERGLFFCKRDA